MTLLNSLIESEDRLTNEDLARRIVIRARAMVLTDRPHTETQSIPSTIQRIAHTHRSRKLRHPAPWTPNSLQA